jgi:mannose-6-phosphate isomerase-like protein (cupin superfamily)
MRERFTEKSIADRAARVICNSAFRASGCILPLVNLPGGLLHSATMPTFIPKPTQIESAGNKPKIIQEFIGRVNSQTAAVSVAKMRSPSGWVEPGQTPEFDEYTVVLAGSLRVESRDGALDVAAGQAVITHAGEWVRYSTPHPDGAEYIAVCLPAFSPQTVHRDA